MATFTRRSCSTRARTLWMMDQTGGIEQDAIQRWGRGAGTQITKLSTCHRSGREMKAARIRNIVLTRPRCVTPASRSLTASSSDEFSWDSAPWSSLSFFAKPQPPHSLRWLLFFDITWKSGWNSPLIAASGLRSSVAQYVEHKWQQRIPIWGDADAQPEGLASCLASGSISSPRAAPSNARGAKTLASGEDLQSKSTANITQRKRQSKKNKHDNYSIVFVIRMQTSALYCNHFQLK